MEAIEVHDLVKNYGQVTALKGIDLKVHKGEIFALLGPNGAGKTTLFSILSTLRRPTSGKAIVLGYDVMKNRSEIRNHIGIVFQEPAIDDRITALDNLRLMAVFYGFSQKESRDRARNVLEQLGMSDLEKRPPRKMSGGQKRRLELARAIVAKPELLFLDEATLGLDVDTRRMFWSQVKRLAENGTTIFLTTHYMEEAEIADRIAMIAKGEIVALDTPKKLKKRVSGGLIKLSTADNESALQWLKENDIEAKTGDEKIYIVSQDPSSLLPIVLKKLPQEVQTAEIHAPSLEDVFLTLTGRSLQDGEVALDIQDERRVS
jgi:ABC-2 type transport system ATP-binding protein